MKRYLAALAALIAAAGVAWGANNFAINNATGTFSIIKSTDDGTGAQIINVSAVPSSGSAAGVPYASTAALAANKVVASAAANLYSFEVAADSTLAAAAWWIMIYDATSAPVDGAVTPAKCYPMPLGSVGYSASWATPIRFATGVVIGVSTNGCFTKAESVHAFISGDAK